jgi:hypothetical protein
MSINKIFLEKDGLVVGTNQLVTSGNGVSVGNNLVVQGGFFPNKLSANGSLGVGGQVLTTNGTGLYWASPSAGFTNGQSIQVQNMVISGVVQQNTIFQGNVILSNAVFITGISSFIAGISSGNQVSGSVLVTGGIGVTDSVYVGNRIGYANSSNVSTYYTYYNSSTGTLDTVFG